ncbi:hypothetical protein QQS21_012049 [Conoideocrella luteorostrata]|uniref:Uncharacterized protein n=1 Tax=Conoideocrella luteorostrata TaxID=1105319 RepID=A0AAJ0CE93_9HYPO|nr:hypothetical protein QQS21_012049 [Conoideocrella luteorostrata]
MSGLTPRISQKSCMGALDPEAEQKPPFPNTAVSKSPAPRSRSKTIGNIFLFVLLAAWLGYRNCCLLPSLYHSLKVAAHLHLHTAEPTIPNQVHYVKLLRSPGSRAEFSFGFTDFLSVYAAWHYWRPHAIYLHTNAVEATITGARDGYSGKWTKLMLQIPNLTVLQDQAPITAENGVEIVSWQHKTEFVAVEAVRDMGGAYMGFDVFALRNIKSYLEEDTKFVAHSLGKGSISHDFFMSSKGGAVVDAWASQLGRTYSAGTISPSDLILGELTAKAMFEGPREIAVMGPTAFLSDKQNATTSLQLFQARDGQYRHRSNRHGCGNNDLSSQHFLQVNSPHKAKWTGTAFEPITPQNLLERRSDFARALYPVTKALLDKGLIHPGSGKA